MSKKINFAKFLFVGLIFNTLIFVCSNGSFATVYPEKFWTTDGVTICFRAASDVNAGYGIVTDGSGGAIIAWHDQNLDYDILAQRIDGSGSVKWLSNGTTICAAVNDQKYPSIVSDGQGGAVIVWRDYRAGNWDIYAQRINSYGTPEWTSGGVVVCNDSGNQERSSIASDGMGGYLIAWSDSRSGKYDIYAQRIRASDGSPMWLTNGVVVRATTLDAYDPKVVDDGQGGAIMTWWDYRNGVDYNIYAQRVDSGGSVAWVTNGMPICTATLEQSGAIIVKDGSGGAIMTWGDKRSGNTNTNIYMQKINHEGIVQWTTDGTTICALAGGQVSPLLLGDDAGGAIISWNDANGIDVAKGIYAQKVDSNGSLKWGVNGVLVCSPADPVFGPSAMISDDRDGIILTWFGTRINGRDIAAQRIDSDGTVKWAVNGFLVCTAPTDQYSPQAVSDGQGGAIIDFVDSRSGGNYTIYAQRVAEVSLFDSKLLYVNGLKLRDGLIISSNISAEVDLRDPYGISSVKVIVSSPTQEYVLQQISGSTSNEGVWAASFTLPLGEHSMGFNVRNGNGMTDSVTFSNLLVGSATGGPVAVIGSPLNYPNPFKPLSTDPTINITRIQYALTADAPIILAIYDIAGHEVKRFVFSAGEDGGRANVNNVFWNGRNVFGEVAGNGMYVYKIISGGKAIGTGKLVILD